MRATKTANTKAHIIASTAAIFNEKGYAGTSITDITRATRLTSGSIYGNFANKEAVALAAFDYNLAHFREVVQREVDKCRTTTEKLFMYINAYHSSAKLNFPRGGCPMQNALTDADDTLESLRKKAADGILRWKQDLTDIINTGIREGVFYSEIRAEKTAVRILALIEIAFLIHSAQKNRKLTDQILENALEVAQEIVKI